ncbi:MAG: carbohydrate-binding protein [Myxococcaceae bacterium]
MTFRIPAAALVTSLSLALVVGCGGDPSQIHEGHDTQNRDPRSGEGQGVDRFGVTMLFPSKEGGEAWFLADEADTDPRFDPQDPITRNADGSWKMQTDQVRMNVMTSTGYDPTSISTYNRDELAARGYMQSPKDWKNVEITGFVKLNQASDETDNFAWYARGGRHNDDNGGCEGSAYKGDLHFDGRTRWAKETWHVSYEYTDYQTATTSIVGRWVGFKAVIYDTTVDGKKTVKMESYLNDNGDGVTWTKVHEQVDAVAWGGDATACGASNDAMPITWGGPTATFRWDSAPDVDFKWLSVREIQP